MFHIFGNILGFLKDSIPNLSETGVPSSDGGWVEYSLENNENTFFISQSGQSDVTLEIEMD